MKMLSMRRRRKRQVPFTSLIPFSPPNITLKDRLHVWREMVSRICDWYLNWISFIEPDRQVCLATATARQHQAVRGLRIQLVRTCHVYPQTSLLKIHECNHWSHFVGSAARYADNKWPATEDHERNEWDRADHKTKDSFVSVIIWNLVWHHLQ